MAAGKPVKISILADTRDAVQGFDKAGKAAKDTGTKFDSVAESSDRVASKGAQAAGALSGLGSLVGGKFGAAMQAGGVATQALADSGDLLNVITESNIVRKIKDAAVTAAQTTATIAKTVADKAAAAAARVWAVAQWALNAAMSANPIGLVVIAIAALVAAFVIAYKKSETFRDIVTGAWDAIKAATSAVWGAVKGLVTGAVSAIATVIRTYFNIYKTVITGVWNAVSSATAAVWNGLKSVVRNGVDGVMTVVRGIKDRVTGAFKNAAGWLLNEGAEIINGLVQGLRNAGHKVTDFVESLIDKIPKKIRSLMGIASPSKVTKRLGQYIVQGLAEGITKDAPQVERAIASTLGNITNMSADLSGALTLDAASALSASSQQTTSISLKLSAQQVSQLQRGREILADIDVAKSAGFRVRAS